MATLFAFLNSFAPMNLATIATVPVDIPIITIQIIPVIAPLKDTAATAEGPSLPTNAISTISKVPKRTFPIIKGKAKCQILRIIFPFVRSLFIITSLSGSGSLFINCTFVS